MRPLALATIAALAACYSPQFAPCAVHCDDTAPCPSDLMCGADRHCHAEGDTTVCPNDVVVRVKKDGTGGGAVMSPSGIDCGTSCAVTVAPGTTVALAATPDPGSRFTGWSSACSGTDTCVIVATTDSIATAGFNQSQELDVTFSGTGGGMVTSMPAGIACDTDCAALFDTGASVTLYASPDASSYFATWSGPCVGIDPCTVQLDAMTTVGVEFD
jgi:hypothetical protein